MGRLILAIEKARGEFIAEPDAALAQKVLNRAHTLLQASQSASVANLLDGRSIAEYLDPAWVTRHPSVAPSIEALAAAMSVNEDG